MLAAGTPIGTYRIAWSRDPAIRQPVYPTPPEAPTGQDTRAAEERQAVSDEYARAVEDHRQACEEIDKRFDTDLRVARETQDYGPILVPGQRPTYFVMKSIPAAVASRLADQRRMNGGSMGPHEWLATMLLLALQEVENGGFVVEKVDDAVLRCKRASDDVLDHLERMSVSAGQPRGELRGELAAAVYHREVLTDPKS